MTLNAASAKIHISVVKARKFITTIKKNRKKTYRYKFKRTPKEKHFNSFTQIELNFNNFGKHI
jgi:hypothetical protein